VKITGTRLAVYAAVLLGSTVAAAADEGGPLHERFSLGLGTFFMSSETTVRADAFDSGEIGTPFDLEDTFGMHDETVFRVDASWRMGERHLLRAMYFDSHRTGRQTLSEDIEFGDETFPIDAAVGARFDFDITELAYEYIFLARDNYQLGGSFGVHNAGFSLGLDAEANGVGAAISESVRTNAPLPVLGLRGRWRLAENVYVLAHAQYFKLAFDAYDGDIRDYEASLIWQVKRHMGIGVAYNLFATQIGSEDRDHFEGHLRWQYSGAQLFMRMSF